MLAEDRKTPVEHFFGILAQLVLSTIEIVPRKVVYTQCVLNEAIAACALERYRIEHGDYPDSLDAANHPGEKPIPLDVVSGKPMGYRRTSDGRYALWCIGLDGKDDGGKRGTGGSPTNPKYSGDWVWDFPAK
jgi:hypothetical protein